MVHAAVLSSVQTWHRLQGTFFTSMPLGAVLHAGNRQPSRLHHLTTTTRIQFVFFLLFTFCIPSGLKITIALISMGQAKLEGFWYL